MPLATDVLSGERADDGLYIPLIKRIEGTRPQGERKKAESFSVEPGEIGLAPLEEAGDGIDQDAEGRLAQLAAGLAER